MVAPSSKVSSSSFSTAVSFGLCPAPTGRRPMTAGLLRTNSTVSTTESTVVKMDMMARAVCQP